MTDHPRSAPPRPQPPGRGEGSATIVVCEDDLCTLELLCEHLVAERFDALPAPSGADALRLCRYAAPDLVLLDLALPDASGLDVLREIREGEARGASVDPRLPVIILSARGGEAERVRGLEAGADDYLVKPFGFPELRARIGALLRRAEAARRERLQVGELVVEVGPHRAWVAGREAGLSRTEFSLLAVLASDPERVFSKRELVEALWGLRAPERTRALDSHASRLRRKLDPEHGRYVINCWGVGFRLWDGAPGSPTPGAGAP